MNKLLCIVLSLMLLLGCSFAFAETTDSGLQKDLVILFTSDAHCGIEQGWGYAGLYAIKEGLSSKNHVLLVDNGDAIQGEPIGTLTKGEALINIMNTLGYDAAIPGNHEFDYGMDRFLELVGKANFPYISCNLNKQGELLLPPYLIKEVDGVKIAFIGVTTPQTLYTSTPAFFKNEAGEYIYGFMGEPTGEELYKAVQKAVDDARAEGADYVIMLAHLGNEEECIPWTYFDVIAHTNGIDAFLDGHAHDMEQVVMKNKDGKNVIRSACGTKLANIGALTITTKGEISSKLFTWGQDIDAPELLNLQNPTADVVRAEKGAMSEILGTVIGLSTVELFLNDPTAKMEDGRPVRISRNSETNMGDFCADAFLDQSGEADIGFINGAGMHAAISKGEITMNDMLDVFPYGNSLTVARVSGQTVLDVLEWSVHRMPNEFSGFFHAAGITYEIDSTVPTPCIEELSKFVRIDDTMERRIRNVQVGGKPIDPNASYKVASSSYLLKDKGNGYTMFEGCEILQDSVKPDYQVLIDYITGTLKGVIGEEYENPYGQGRAVSVNPEN